VKWKPVKKSKKKQHKRFVHKFLVSKNSPAKTKARRKFLSYHIFFSATTEHHQQVSSPEKQQKRRRKKNFYKSKFSQLVFHLFLYFSSLISCVCLSNFFRRARFSSQLLLARDIGPQHTRNLPRDHSERLFCAEEIEEEKKILERSQSRKKKTRISSEVPDCVCLALCSCTIYDIYLIFMIFVI
jgi:hypothetical protein